MFAHGSTDLRRNPLAYGYEMRVCTKVGCAARDCPLAHGDVELRHHPLHALRALRVHPTRLPLIATWGGLKELDAQGNVLGMISIGKKVRGRGGDSERTSFLSCITIASTRTRPLPTAACSSRTS
eukprot:6845142-Prymnesium_polylepis.1